MCSAGHIWVEGTAEISVNVFQVKSLKTLESPPGIKLSSVAGISEERLC